MQIELNKFKYNQSITKKKKKSMHIYFEKKIKIQLDNLKEEKKKSIIVNEEKKKTKIKKQKFQFLLTLYI